MLKYVYRVLILTGIFLASLFYFRRDIKEVTFDIDNTIEMSETTLPVVTIRTGKDDINRLNGYSSNLNANAVRGSVTPLDGSQEFEVIIDEDDYTVKKLNYEIREPVGNHLIESGSVSVFAEEEENLKAKISINEELELEKEYVVKITLITSESSKMYYYNRIKCFNQFYLHEILEYVKHFHNSIKDKEKVKEVVKHLEPDKKKSDNTSLAKVNIHSDLELITWGGLQPEFITEPVPSIIEVYPHEAFVVLDYFVETNISEHKELYRVKEFYRVRYTSDSMYLINYERTMESVFDVKLASVSQNQLKLGITSQYEIPHLTNSDGMKLAFTRNRELWLYDMNENDMVRVFSFRQEDTDYIRDLYDQHDVRLLNMDEEGNIDFLVYGYMNRGHYEGRVGIILYHYINADNRIEERVFIPIDEPYDILKESLGEFTYVNNLDVFYFQIDNNIYAYDKTTQELIILGENVHDLVIMEDKKHIAWQVSSDPRLSDEIKIMDLETRQIQAITAPSGHKIRLLDQIDENIIYGYVEETDIESLLDGRLIAPIRDLKIASTDKNILKEYKGVHYVSDVEVEDNIVELNLIKKTSDNKHQVYEEAGQDYIMNQLFKKVPAIEIITRTSDESFTELYLKISNDFVMEKVPKLITTLNTVISEDPTLRLPISEQESTSFYSYLHDGINGVYNEAYIAIDIAKENIGTVVDKKNHVVWEAGPRSNTHVINEFERMSWDETSTRSIETCLKLLLQYQGVNRNIDQLRVDNKSIMDVLQEHSKFDPVRLTGASLDDTLYSIYKGRPVIAMKSRKEALLIYGYDNFNILVIDPSKGRSFKMGLIESASLFEESGNMFISYLE